MKRLALLVVCVAGLLAFAAPALAGTTISTVSSWNGSDDVNEWGVNETPTYGQTILGNGRSLSSWTFYMDVDSNEKFRGAVYTWNGNEAGTQLFVSGDMTAPAGSGFRPVTFVIPGGVTLAAGQEYVLFATTLLSTQSPGFIEGGNAIWGGITTGVDPGVYPDGEYVYTNNPDPAGLTGAGWDGNHGYDFGQDLAFTAQFGSALDESTRVVVCTGQSVQRGDGSQGRFADVAYSFWLASKDDPSSTYYESTPAIYVQGFGTMCAISDVATYGGDPSAFIATGATVDELGMSSGSDGALYEYYAKT